MIVFVEHLLGLGLALMYMNNRFLFFLQTTEIYRADVFSQNNNNWM